MTERHQPRQIVPGDLGTNISRRRILQLGVGLIGGSAFLNACGDDKGSSSTSAAPVATTGTTAAPVTTAASDTTVAAGGLGRPVKVGFAYIGPVNDNGWTQEHHRGRQLMIDALGANFDPSSKFVENVGFDPAVTGPIFEDLAANHDLVFANTEYSSLLSDVVAKHPNVKFMECDGHTHSANQDSYYLAHVKPTYALGVAAAMLNKDNDCKIGYIGAFPTATAYNDCNGLLLGARSVNPKATVKAVMISSFFDPPKATAAAKALIGEDINFLFAVMDEPSFLTVANDAGVWAGAWNTDVRQFGPKVYVNTLQLEFGDYYTEVAKSVLDGTWLADGKPELLPIDLGGWGDAVPAEVSAVVDPIRVQLQSGALNPYTGPIIDNKGVERVKAGETLDDQAAYLVDWAVDGVSGVDG